MRVDGLRSRFIVAAALAEASCSGSESLRYRRSPPFNVANEGTAALEWDEAIGESIGTVEVGSNFASPFTDTLIACGDAMPILMSDDTADDNSTCGLPVSSERFS